MNLKRVAFVRSTDMGIFLRIEDHKINGEYATVAWYHPDHSNFRSLEYK